MTPPSATHPNKGNTNSAIIQAPTSTPFQPAFSGRPSARLFSPPFQPAFSAPPVTILLLCPLPLLSLSPFSCFLRYHTTSHLISHLFSPPTLPPLSPLSSHFSFFLLPPLSVSLVSPALPTLSFSPEPCRLVSPTGSVARRKPVTSGEAKVPWLVPGWLFAWRACNEKPPFCSRPALSVTAKAHRRY